MVGGLASIAVLATTVCDPRPFAADVSSSSSDEEFRFQPWGNAEEDVPEQPVDAEPPDGEGHWVQFVDRSYEPVESRLLVSAPGMWPFVSKTTDRLGYLDLPSAGATRLNGRNMAMYEVVARAQSDDEPSYGFWGTIRGPDEQIGVEDAVFIEMEEAAPLELEIIDDEGEPIVGAHVRLARDRVGLVYLEYTTGADGVARFSGIPTGTYHVTLDADGHARRSLDIPHTKRRSGAMQVALDDGGSLRRPQAWRGPPVVELAESGGSSGTSGDGSDAASTAGSDDTSSDDAHDETGPPTRSFDVRVANSRGAGVGDAWIEVWADGGRVDQAISAGRQRTRLEAPADTHVELVATHAGWGEGTKQIGAVDDDGDYVVRLDGDLMSSPTADDRLRRIREIEEELELELVDRRGEWLVDRPRSGSLAAEAGFERGDSLLFVRNQLDGHLAVVERGDDLVEVSIP